MSGAASSQEFIRTVYAFASWVNLDGVRGPTCIEAIGKPPKNCPQATMRLMVRWEGRVKAGTLIETSSGSFVVLRFFPASPRMPVAHMLCRRAGAEKPS